MFLIVDGNDDRPLYRQIAEGIKALIACGELRQGATLPSVRQLAGDLGVNLNTIAVAYRQLQDEGFVAVRHGAGVTVASDRVRGADEETLRRPLRTALTQWILAGRGDQEILRAVRQEIEGMRKKGECL